LQKTGIAKSGVAALDVGTARELGKVFKLLFTLKVSEIFKNPFFGDTGRARECMSWVPRITYFPLY